MTQMFADLRKGGNWIQIQRPARRRKSLLENHSITKHMNKISARDIQLFVAGALAMMGFRTLIWIPYYIVQAHYLVIVSSLITGIALPIGLGIFFGRPSALLWAQIYLGLCVGATMLVLPVYWFTTSGRTTPTTFPIQSLAPELLTDLALLALIFWSRSRKLAGESQATTSAGG